MKHIYCIYLTSLDNGSAENNALLEMPIYFDKLENYKKYLKENQHCFIENNVVLHYDYKRVSLFLGNLICYHSHYKAHILFFTRKTEVFRTRVSFPEFPYTIAEKVIVTQNGTKLN